MAMKRAARVGLSRSVTSGATTFRKAPTGSPKSLSDSVLEICHSRSKTRLSSGKLSSFHSLNLYSVSSSLIVFITSLLHYRGSVSGDGPKVVGLRQHDRKA